MEACRYQESKLLIIKVGASGFSFDDWKGPVYPPNIKKQGIVQCPEKVYLWELFKLRKLSLIRMTGDGL